MKICVNLWLIMRNKPNFQARHLAERRPRTYFLMCLHERPLLNCVFQPRICFCPLLKIGAGTPELYQRCDYVKQSQFPETKEGCNASINNELQRKTNNGHLVKTNPTCGERTCLERSRKSRTNKANLPWASALVLSAVEGARRRVCSELAEPNL